MAAGSSSRLGRPKQLLRYKEESLLTHATSVAAATNVKPVIVVLGNDAGVFSKELHEKINITVNEKWNEGIASSIRSGVTELMVNYPSVDGVIIMVCDQPFVTTELLNELISTQQETGKPIVASNYDGVNGTPALFHRAVFSQLAQLSGDTGARKIIQQHITDCISIPFVNGGIDIDTLSDYQNLLNTDK